MSKIQVLSLHLANQIAAGEVVERPASIIKELVENAIDAGSSTITVEIQGGGIDYLRVSDNGGGISAQDVPTAFFRHATSKISTAEDLAHIHTLGFRGEALSSIAAVARVRLITRTRDDEAGTAIEIEGGEVKTCGPAAWAEGTSVEVRDVFYNVPARRKFLKSSRAEAAAIGDFLSRAILANPTISFRFLNSGKIIYQSAGDGELKNAIYSVYGSEVLTHLKPLLFDDGRVKISGYLGTEQLARPNRLQQSLFVNGRYIHSQKISFAAQRAFETRLMSGKFPFYVMNLQLPWDAVDVNVHPQKMEVRFHEEEIILRAVTVACRMALGDSTAPLVRGADIPAFQRQDSRFAQEDTSLSTEGANTNASPVVEQNLRDRLGSYQPAKAPSLREAASFFVSPVKAEISYLRPAGPEEERSGLVLEQETDLPALKESNPVEQLHKDIAPAEPTQATQATMHFGAEPYRIIGQLFDCYWVVQQGERVFFIDQHAAHERRLYERLMAGELAKASQVLLLPAVVKLPPAQFDLLFANLSAFEELGFEIEEFGALTVRIRAVPDILGEAQTTDFLFDALSLLEKQGRANANELKRASLIQASCKHAIKAGAALAPQEIEALLAEYANSGVPMTCPHGRPVMVQMRKLEFEKLFKRVL